MCMYLIKNHVVDVYFQLKCSNRDWIYSWNLVDQKKKNPKQTIHKTTVFKTLDLRQWRTAIHGKCETNEVRLWWPQPTALREFPGHLREGNRGGARWTPWVEEWSWESRENKAVRVYRALDRVLERRELDRERTHMIYRDTPWTFSRMLVSTCSWRTNWVWGRKFPKWVEGTVPGAHTGPGTMPVLPASGKLLIHGALGRVLRKILPH